MAYPQLGAGGPAHCLKAAPDQRRDVGIGPRNGAEDLSAPVGTLDIADANFQIRSRSLSNFVTPPRSSRRRPRRPITITVDSTFIRGCQDGERRMAAQCLGTLAGLDRQKIRQNVGDDTKGHEGGKMRSQLIQLRRRPTMREPPGTRRS